MAAFIQQLSQEDRNQHKATWRRALASAACGLVTLSNAKLPAVKPTAPRLLLFVRCCRGLDLWDGGCGWFYSLEESCNKKKKSNKGFSVPMPLMLCGWWKLNSILKPHGLYLVIAHLLSEHTVTIIYSPDFDQIWALGGWPSTPSLNLQDSANALVPDSTDTGQRSHHGSDMALNC